MFFIKKTLYLVKTAITFVYELRLKSILYKKVSTRKVTSEFTVVLTNFRISKFKRENRLFCTFIFSNLFFYFF
jgi:hypothetical protein